MKIPFVSLQKMHQEISLEMKNKFSEIYDKNMFIQGQETALFEEEFVALNFAWAVVMDWMHCILF